MPGNAKLDALKTELSRQGADPRRIDLVERARRFKRSWIEMAEGLAAIANDAAFEGWGYPDLYSYCAHELSLKRATVDKLMGSYATVKRHAPQVLKRDGVERTIPSYESVDYFARTLELHEEDRRRAPRAVIEELREAVFEDAAPVTVLRRRFNPVLSAKPQPTDALSAAVRTRAQLKRFAELLSELGLHEHEKRLDRADRELAAIERSLQEHVATSAEVA